MLRVALHSSLFLQSLISNICQAHYVLDNSIEECNIAKFLLT